MICNKAPYPANDGSSIAIYNMAKGLLENNVDVDLLAINTKKHFKPDNNVPDKFKTDTNYQSVFHNTNTSLIGAFLNLFSSQSYFVSRFLFENFGEELKQKLKLNKYDIIQIEGLFMAVYIPLIKKISSAKIVLRAHNIEHVIWERHIQNEKNILKKWYLNLQNKRLKHFETDILNSVDAVVTITTEDEKYIRDKFPSQNITTAITGISLSDYPLAQKSAEPNTVFYFGSMDWLPNQEAVEWFVSNCWQKIKQEIPSAKFIIAGRNMPERIKALEANGIKCVENVADKNEFYHTYQLMIVPLLSGSGLRIKIIEGMAFGKTIVSTSVGAEGIPVNNGHEVIIADSADEIVKAVVNLLTNHQEFEKIGLNARQFAENNFVNKSIVGHLTNFYTQLLK